MNKEDLINFAWIETITVSFPFDLLSYTDEQIEECTSKQFNK